MIYKIVYKGKTYVTVAESMIEAEEKFYDWLEFDSDAVIDFSVEPVPDDADTTDEGWIQF